MKKSIKISLACFAVVAAMTSNTFACDHTIDPSQEITQSTVSLPQKIESSADVLLRHADHSYENNSYGDAIVLYKSAAEKGSIDAMYKLGSMAFEGVGMPQNYSDAFKAIKFAAMKGHPLAQVSLGDMYSKGLGTEINRTSAHAWYNIAAANGQEIAIGKRDTIAKTMEDFQIKSAQILASKCMKTYMKKCKI